jgi:hypothetical protein
MINSTNSTNSNNSTNSKKQIKNIFQNYFEMLSIKNIIIGSVENVIPWTILLLIVGFIIII